MGGTARYASGDDAGNGAGLGEASAVPRPPRTYSQTDAAWKLGGLNRKTLNKWMQAGRFTYGRDEVDRRLLTISEAQLRRLAELHGVSLREGQPPLVRERSGAVRRLERQVADLQGELAAVREEHAAILRKLDEVVAFIRLPLAERDRGAGRGPETRQDEQETAGEGEVAYRPRPRVAPPTRPLSAHERLNAPPLPENWMSVSTWSNKHGLHDYSRSVTRAIHETLDPAERMPQSTPGPFVGPTGQLLSEAYDWPEQHLAAAQKAREKWPDHFRPCPLCEDLL